MGFMDKFPSRREAKRCEVAERRDAIEAALERVSAQLQAGPPAGAAAPQVRGGRWCEAVQRPWERAARMNSDPQAAIAAARLSDRPPPVPTPQAAAAAGAAPAGADGALASELNASRAELDKIRGFGAKITEELGAMDRQISEAEAEAEALSDVDAARAAAGARQRALEARKGELAGERDSVKVRARVC